MTVSRDPITQDGQRISKTGKALVESESAPRDFFVSRDDGQVYTIISSDIATAANEETIYLQNISSTTDIIIDDIIVNSVDNVYKFKLKYVTGTAAGSSTITAVNLNKTSPHAAESVSRGNGAITGLTDDGDVAIGIAPAGGETELQFEEALRLGQNDAIAIESLSIADVSITIEFHFEDE